MPCTDLGEAALVQLTLRAADHDRLVDLDGSADERYGRHVWLQHDQLRHGNAMVDLVAVAENFTSRRLLELRPELTDNDVFSWEKRCNAWAIHAEVDLTKITPDWQALRGFIEARNALQHGLGRLTDFQLDARRRETVLTYIKAARIYLTGDLIHVSATSVIDCHHICKTFVLALVSCE